MSIVASTTRDLVLVSGPDAATYLQGQLSQDVAGLVVGSTASTFVLAPQGKVDGWGRLHRSADDRFELVVDAGAGEAWEARLRRFLLRTKAEIEVRPGAVVVALRGAEADDVLAALEGPAGEGWLPSGWPGEEGGGADRIVAVGSDGPGADAVVAAAVAAGADPVGEDELETRRIRCGVPRWGKELDADTIPATVGQWVIDASVSFTKGCYTGQELVARIDSRGGNVPRVLHRIEVEGAVPEVGAPVVAVTGSGELDAGTVTSSAADGRGAVALAFVPRAVEVGPDGTEASVAGTPARLLPPAT